MKKTFKEIFNDRYKDDFEYIYKYESIHTIKCLKCGKIKEIKDKKIYEKRYIICSCDKEQRRKPYRKKHKIDVDKLEDKFIVKFKNKYGECFEYISGYKDGRAIIKCKQCNQVKDVYINGIFNKKNNIACNNCLNNRKGINERICLDCGCKFISYSDEHIRCNNCKVILRKSKRAIRKRMRELKIKSNGNSDYSISLEKLIERDRGICKICGNKIRLNDYSYNSEGHRITGKEYPSIDHIIPLSKGGEHTWENVQLAHFYCNSIKCDSI